MEGRQEMAGYVYQQSAWALYPSLKISSKYAIRDAMHRISTLSKLNPKHLSLFHPPPETPTLEIHVSKPGGFGCCRSSSQFLGL
jgi:hypothetical protein